jgi:hypothetical protein
VDGRYEGFGGKLAVVTLLLFYSLAWYRYERLIHLCLSLFLRMSLGRWAQVQR